MHFLVTPCVCVRARARVCVCVCVCVCMARFKIKATIVHILVPPQIVFSISTSEGRIIRLDDHSSNVVDRRGFFIIRFLLKSSFGWTTAYGYRPVRATTSYMRCATLYTSCELIFLPLCIHLDGTANTSCTIAATAHSKPNFVGLGLLCASSYLHSLLALRIK